MGISDNKKDRKRDKKAKDKKDKKDKKKSVKFSGDDDVIESNERKWNDFKGRKAFAVMG